MPYVRDRRESGELINRALLVSSRLDGLIGRHPVEKRVGMILPDSALSYYSQSEHPLQIRGEQLEVLRSRQNPCSFSSLI
jgi:hypothetical protein